MIRNLLYKESFFKKTAQFMIPSDELRNKLKNIINSLNSSDYNQNESKDEINISKLDNKRSMNIYYISIILL